MQGPEKRKEQGHASLRTPSRTGKFKPPQTWAACYQAVAYFLYRMMKPVSLEKLRLSNRILIATRYGRKMTILARFTILPFLAVLLPAGPGPALAAEKGPPAGIGAESTGAVEPAPVIAMSVADCRRLLARIGSGDVLHQPDPGVNYQPGRDVDSQGRPIAPADLPGSNPLPLDGMIELPIRLPLSKLTGVKVPSSIADESKLRIATVGIDPMTGQLSFNGQPLQPGAGDAVTRACRDAMIRPQAN